MAEPCNRAFGRYLKTLRERRSYSLEDVCSLSQTFPEKITKGYLSRCENGRQRLAFSKLIPLSRIYEVPSDVLVERMELDLELDRVGSPDTEGMSYEELTAAGRKAINEGFLWEAYGFLRDAMIRSTTDTVRECHVDAKEQCLVSEMNCGSAALKLGRVRYSLHEFQYVRSAGHLGPKFSIIALERISQCHWRLRDFDLSRETADTAVREAEESGDSYTMGYVYSNRALVAAEEGDHSLACKYYQKTFEQYKKAELNYECARTLNNLAQTYFELGRLRSARKALEASHGISLPLHQHRTRALGMILLGEIEVQESRHEPARKQLLEAANIAKRLNDRVLRFKAEFQLYKIAKSDGDQPVARAIRRRLARLTPWLPPHTPELDEFKTLLG